jgi:hypothetical protein
MNSIIIRQDDYNAYTTDLYNPETCIYIFAYIMLPFYYLLDLIDQTYRN